MRRVGIVPPPGRWEETLTEFPNRSANRLTYELHGTTRHEIGRYGARSVLGECGEVPLGVAVPAHT
jgi:hypothetical protein